MSEKTRLRLVNKVVRDRISELLSNSDDTVTYKPIMDDELFRAELQKKLGEELAEYLLSGDVQELVDLQAVLNAVAFHCHGRTPRQMLEMADVKARRKIDMWVQTLEAGKEPK